MTTASASLLDRARVTERAGNRDGRDLWDLYRGHRERLTAAILALAPDGGGRLCLLGAGNANDVDLAQLAARFVQIHLVDIDASALARAVSRQTRDVRAKLRCHAPVDLSGLLHQLDGLPDRLPPHETLVEQGTRAARKGVPETFEVVVSCCLLSQMAFALAHATKGDQASFRQLEQAMVNVHLRILLDLIHPRGSALIAADLISSDQYPLEETATQDDLSGLARRLEQRYLAYPSSNPELLRGMLRRDRKVRHACGPLHAGLPWLWTAAKGSTYLVRPVWFQRRA